jgi:hypothetical protein
MIRKTPSIWREAPATVAAMEQQSAKANEDTSPKVYLMPDGSMSAKSAGAIGIIEAYHQDAPGTGGAGLAPDPEKEELPVAAVERKAVTSRVQNVNEGQCPICDKTLTPKYANGHSVLVCLEHNIIMPTRD